MTQKAKKDRAGNWISEGSWENLRRTPNYSVVRRYRSSSANLGGPLLECMVHWTGWANRLFEVEQYAPGTEAKTEVAHTEQEAINLYEHFLAEHGAGEWFPSGGALDAVTGKQVSSTMQFMTKGNIYRDDNHSGAPIAPKDHDAMVENAAYASW